MVTVLSVEPGKQVCPSCGKTVRIFQVHAFREENRPVLARCKARTIQLAGAEEKVWIRTTFRSGEKIWQEQTFQP